MTTITSRADGKGYRSPRTLIQRVKSVRTAPTQRVQPPAKPTGGKE